MPLQGPGCIINMKRGEMIPHNKENVAYWMDTRIQPPGERRLIEGSQEPLVRERSGSAAQFSRDSQGYERSSVEGEVGHASAAA